jgi:branched-chain amino acid transport system ATP-binding protein
MNQRPDPILVAEHLRLQYRNGALGILDVSLQVGPGEIVGLFGANGAGKTSTVRSIGGFLRSEGARVISGRVLLAGQNVTNREPHRVAREGLACVPERNKVFADFTVQENLTLVGRLPPQSRRAELTELISGLFPVLKSRLQQLAGQLSGGERQMLALARAIMADPKVLVIDEMTLGLHHSVQPILFSAVEKIAAAGSAVLLVDESTGLALDVVNYAYVLASGEIRDEGPPQHFHNRELLVAGYTGAGAA